MPFSDQPVQKTYRGAEHVTHEDITPEQEEAERSKPAGRTKLTRLFVVLLVLVAWFGLAGVGGPLVGRLSEVQKNDNASFLPKSAESTEVGKLAAKFSSTDALPYFVVIERPTGLKPSDADAVKSFIAGIPSLPFEIKGYSLGPYLAAPPAAAVPSQDGKALLVPVLLNAETAAEVIGDSSPLYEGAKALKASAASTLAPTGLAVYVAGPGGVLADFVTAFAGIDGILLLVALGVVFFILLVVYRSPILPITVLMTAVFGLAVAAMVIYPLAKNDVIGLNGQSQGILSILVVGAATDYSLLLVARYREELHQHPSKWVAMGVAWRAAFSPIAASGATVILGLLCLLLSQLGSTRGLGPIGALGIAGALVSALTFLPAVLLLFGRRIFWPIIPRVDHVHAEDSVGRRGIWGRVAAVVGRHPRRTWVLTLVALLACASFAPTLKADGITQSQIFLNKVESVTGQEILAKHFPAGSGSPVQIIAPQAKAEQVLAEVKSVSGVASAFVGETPGVPPKVVDGEVLVQATLTPAADSPAAEVVVEKLRGALDRVGADVLVGGSTAVNFDVRQASQRDLRVIIPAILAVVFLVLMLLLRSLVAPVVLVIANVISFAATLGVAALVFDHVFHFPGSDPATPLYAFVFLVALGIDYSIFLMTRVREESADMGTRPGVLVALAVTGGVITSAGIVLASTFSALAIIPLVFLAQIAFIVAFGVLLDTMVVRSLLVPAFTHELGRRIWWPSRLSQEPTSAEGDSP
ncbi:MAG TPA: MMPL family transporter [Dermatophilaceae bacterium]|nr:MMPL family transporter [Dermatophilaceae bacterium]